MRCSTLEKISDHALYDCFSQPAAAIGKRKFDGGHQNQGDIKRRYGAAAAAALGSLGNNWGSQPLPQQPLGTNGGEQWYNDSTYPVWS